MTWSWQGRACLVTGGAGFGGSHLVLELVDRGAEVYVLDREGPDNSALLSGVDSVRRHWIRADVRDIETLRMAIVRYEIDTIFHLAAQPLVEMSKALPAETLSVNVDGTCAVLEAIRTARVSTRLVFASSGAHYGLHTTKRPIVETDIPERSTSVYGSSKSAAEAAVQAYVNAFGLQAAICRFMNTYGPGDTNFSRIIPRAIRNLLRGGPYDFGDRDDGLTKLDFLHIRDMTRAYIAVAEQIDVACGEAFNFGTGSLTQVSDVARLISRVFDGQDRVPLFHGTRRVSPPAKCLDTRKAQNILHWTHTIGLEAGIANTLPWYMRLEDVVSIKR